jgi:hypothetical protein
MSTGANEPTDDRAAGQPTAPPPQPAGAPATATPSTPQVAAAPDQAGAADDVVLEASLESFPGSDAPAWIGSRGTP